MIQLVHFDKQMWWDRLFQVLLFMGRFYQPADANGKTGFLVQNLEEMIQCLSRIDEIDHDETRLHVERNFSARAMTEKYLRVYKNVRRNIS